MSETGNRKQNKALLAGGLLLFLAAILLVFQTCKKFDPQGFLNVETGAVSEITHTSASVSCVVTDDGGVAVSARGVCWSTSPNPTISNNQTSDGTGTGGFDSEITGLSPETTYYIRSYATNSQGTTYGNEVSFPTIETPPEPVSDIDGNEYLTVRIGEQVWMAENLKTTRYADGSAIPLVEGASGWISLDVNERAYCWYDNAATNKDEYGGLYTWGAAMNGAASSDANPSGIQGVCPAGWHLPSDAEWKELEMYLGMSQGDADAQGWRGSDIGGKLKESGTAHWNSPNTGATNESGFTAIPGGSRSDNAICSFMGSWGSYWSSTESDFNGNCSWVRNLEDNSSVVGRHDFYMPVGISVRCLKDD